MREFRNFHERKWTRHKILQPVRVAVTLRTKIGILLISLTTIESRTTQIITKFVSGKIKLSIGDRFTLSRSFLPHPGASAPTLRRFLCFLRWVFCSIGNARGRWLHRGWGPNTLYGANYRVRYSYNKRTCRPVAEHFCRQRLPKDAQVSS